MPDRTHSTRTPKNAFDPGFLDGLAVNDETPTAFKAAHGGFWQVLQIDDEQFGLYRLWEDPDRGDEPFAVLSDRSSAILAAAFLPLVAETRSVWIHPDDDGDGYVLYRDGRPVGRMPCRVDELTEALHLADALARTPTSIAGLLAAADPEAIAQAGRILARGFLPPA